MRSFLFLILSIYGISAIAQVTWLSPLPTGNNLYDVFYLDEDHGWAVGANGTIIAYDANISNEWWLCESPVQADLNAIVMRSDGKGFCIGDGGTVLKTTDSGISWEILDLNTFEDLFGIEYLQTDQVWIVGDDGFIGFSDNSGGTWVEQTNGHDWFLKSICMLNANEGWISGENYSLFRTTDGGLTWVLNYEGYGYCYNTVCFYDNMHGWAGGMSEESVPSGSLIRTADGGQTWTELDGDPYAVYDVHFFDTLNGWMSKGSYFMRSSDGGESWLEYPDEWKNDYYFIDELNGWAVAGLGATYKTIDGGDLWVRTNRAATDEAIWSCTFADMEYGWGGCDNGEVIHTENGGIDWVGQELPGAFLPINDIDFVDKEHGWALSFEHVYRTKNGGEEWDEINYFDDSYYALDFHDSLIGWIVGFKASIQKTLDGGENWTEQASGFPVFRRILDVYFLDDQEGWVAGEQGYSRTTDGGESWIYSTKGAWNTDIFFLDSQHGWMIDLVFSVGTRIWYSENGGVNWQERCWIPDYSFRDLYFVDEEYGFAAASSDYGDANGIFETRDGGITWNANEGSGQMMMDLSFPNQETGWAVGAGGQILRLDADPVSIGEDMTSHTNSSLKVFPNPASSSINLQFYLAESSAVNFQLFSIDGRLLQEEFLGYLNLGGYEYRISVDRLPSGIYFAIVNSGSCIQSKKLVIH